jgi:hypothetical protein
MNYNALESLKLWAFIDIGVCDTMQHTCVYIPVYRPIGYFYLKTHLITRTDVLTYCQPVEYFLRDLFFACHCKSICYLPVCHPIRPTFIEVFWSQSLTCTLAFYLDILTSVQLHSPGDATNKLPQLTNGNNASGTLLKWLALSTSETRSMCH